MNEGVTLSGVTHDQRTHTQKLHDPAGALRADLNRQRAIELRLQGWTFERIGEELGVSGKTAHEYVNDGWERINVATDEDRATLRDLTNARLEKAMQPIMEILMAENLVTVSEDGNGNEVREDGAKIKLQAVDKLVKVVAVQAKLLGLNAPEKLEVTGPKSTLEPLHLLAARVRESMTHRSAFGGSKS